MLLIPAIDLKDGQCVRLKQGDMNDSTTFGEDPAAMARRWVDAGARRLHLVDLNGAFAGKPVNEAAIRAILAEVGDEIPVQLGGGIRDLDTIERYLDDGLSYVIIGTAAVKKPGFLHDACTAFGGHIIVGLDAKDGKVATDGWSKLTGHEVVDLAKKFEDYGVEGVIYTDIGRDGMLTRHQHRSHRQAGAGADHSRHRLGRPEQHGRHRAAVRGRARGHRRRDLRPRDLQRRPGLRRRAARADELAARLTAALTQWGPGHRPALNDSPCSPNASFPASTSPAAASSRASTSSSCATPAIRSRSPRATTSRAPTN